MGQGGAMVLERFRMDDQVAIVTGASRGIGAATAVAFAEAGADVVIGARDADALAQVAAAVARFGRRASVVVGSLHEREALAALVDRAIADHGRITTVVNNVGGSMPARFLDTSERDFDTAMRWNVTTAFNLSQLAAPHMLEAGGASIVNIASMAGVHASRGFVAYGTAKAAMIQLTRTLAADLAPKIRVNAVAPGATRTAALESVLTDDLRARMVRNTPMKRLGEVDDIAAAVLYLASAAGSYVTGQTLAVAGGIQTSNLDMGLPDL